MHFRTYSHRHAATIIDNVPLIRHEIESVIRAISIDDINQHYADLNRELALRGLKKRKGKQAAINDLFRATLDTKGWGLARQVFGDDDIKLVMDYWKKRIGINVVFTHRSFIGSDLLTIQAAGEIQKDIDAAIYICPTSQFAKSISSDAGSMIHFDVAKWYLENLMSVITVPIWLIGLES